MVRGSYKEHIPSIFETFLQEELYYMFVSQYNAYVQQEFRINPLHVKGCKTLLDIFKKKIDGLISDDSFPRCAFSKELIRLYTHQEFEKIRVSQNILPTHIAAKFIFMVFANETNGLLFDGKDFFCNYVYDKVQKRHKDKSVLFYDDFMIMEFSKEQRVGIFPSFKRMNTYKPYLADEDIRRALRVLNDHALSKLFITYPKNSDFRKHIVVEHQVCKARLTLVPYAISHKIVYNSKQTFYKN